MDFAKIIWTATVVLHIQTPSIAPDGTTASNTRHPAGTSLILSGSMSIPVPTIASRLPDMHRTNQNASLSNSSIRTVDHDTLIQPKVCVDGRYPVDFSAPMRLPNFMSLSEIKLDDLLDEYEVSTHEDFDFGGRHYSRVSDFDGRVQKLAALLDFLGARQIADVLRSEAVGLSSRSRPLLAGSGRRFTSSR